MATAKNHPSFTRILAAAARAGSSAQTARGAIRALMRLSRVARQEALFPAAARVSPTEYLAAQARRRSLGIAARMSPAQVARAALPAVTDCAVALDGVQRRARERLLDSDLVLGLAVRAAITGELRSAAADHTVASSYGYRVSYTCAAGHPEGDVVRVCVGRVAGAMADREVTIDVGLASRLRPCATLSGDAVAVAVEGAHGEHCVRFDADGRKTGVAVPMPKDLRRYGIWEHGATIAECKRELAAKRRAIRAEDRERAVMRRNAAERAKDARRARLLARLSTTLTATFADARAAGYCTAGIESWCRARGLDPSGSVSLAALAHDADPQARALAIRVALRCVESRA